MLSSSCIRHALIVFGGVHGIEECTKADESIEHEPAVAAGPDLHDDNDTFAQSLFHMWINTCPEQGSRTIRSEVG